MSLFIFKHGARYFSPAKVNLFLKIEKKRSDGFHDLYSCFQTLNFGDYLFFKESKIDKLSCNLKSIPITEENLVFKALNLFKQYTKITTSFHITLYKNTFIAAGLGGGSSNAATTLFALNQLTKANLSKEELVKLSSQIGSDVSFFLSKGIALCEGKGDRIKELNSSCFSHLQNFLLVPFKELCPTALVYKQFSISKKINFFENSQLLSCLSSNKPIFVNDLEGSAIDLFPELKKQKKTLEKFFVKENIFMSGSGGTFVIWLKDTNILKDFWNQYPDAILTKTIFRQNESVWYKKS